MADALDETLRAIQAMLAGTVEIPCGELDGKGLPCGLEAGHPGRPRHSRMAVPGEAAYLEGPGNSVLTWTEGPQIRRVK